MGCCCSAIMSANCLGEMSAWGCGIPEPGLGLGACAQGGPEFIRHGGKLWLSFPAAGRGAWWLPRQTDDRRHPIRVSLGGSPSSVARFRFPRRLLEYTMPLLTAISLTLLALGKEPPPLLDSGGCSPSRLSRQGERLHR